MGRRGFSFVAALRLVAVLCCAYAPAFWAAAAADDAKPIKIEAGVYHAVGKTAAGKAYEGDVAIEPLGHVKAVLWRLNSGDAYKGIGWEAGSVFGVAYGSSRSFGLVVYRVDGGRLDGRWSVAAQNGKGMGREVLEGPPGLSGTYAITRGENPNGSLYSGQVEISPNGKTYALHWLKPEAFGTGLLVDGNLVVAFDSGPHFGVVAYQRQGNLLHGLWSTARGGELGSEDLTLKAP